MRKAISVTGRIIFIFILLSSTAFCEDLPDNDFVFGAKIGMIGSGKLEVNSININTKTAHCFGVFGDKPIANKLYGGIAVDFFKFKTESDEEYLMNGSFIVKGEFKTANKRFCIQPAFGFGYGIMGELLFLKPLDFVTVQVFGDFIYVTEKKIGLLFSIGAIWLPHAGENEYDVSSGPRVLVRAGARF